MKLMPVAVSGAAPEKPPADQLPSRLNSAPYAPMAPSCTTRRPTSYATHEFWRNSHSHRSASVIGLHAHVDEVIGPPLDVLNDALACCTNAVPTRSMARSARAF